jgi:hypothetical protein
MSIKKSKTRLIRDLLRKYPLLDAREKGFDDGSAYFEICGMCFYHNPETDLFVCSSFPAPLKLSVIDSLLSALNEN